MDKLEKVNIDCPAHRLVGNTHFCGVGTEGDLLCWVAYKHPCQLFEPKPDDSRLLTMNEIMSITHCLGISKNYEDIAKAQDAKTASITQAECQERIERILAVGSKILEVAWHGDYANGNDAFGIDEGRVRAKECLDSLEREWQALKKQEGIQ